MPKSREFSAALQVLTGAVIISFSPVWVKLANVGPDVATFYRCFFGGLILLVLAVRKRERIYRRVPLLGLTLATGLFFMLDLSLWHRSIHGVGPGLATIICNFQVFILAAYGVVILKEKLTARLVMSIPLSLIGLFLLVGVDWASLPADYHTGVFLALASAVAYAGFLLLLRKLQSKSNAALADIAIISLFVALLAWFSAANSGTSLIIPDLKSGIFLVIYGVFGQVVAWVLIARAMPNVEASRIGLILLTQPALAFTWDLLFLSRSGTIREILGATLALGAIYLGSTSPRRMTS